MIIPKTKLILFSAIIFMTSTAVIFGQVVYTPLENNVYNFLERLSIKKIISINDEAKPFSRKYIADKLLLLDKNRQTLNDLEEKELDWLMAEYGNELNLSEEDKRWFLFNYSDSLFSFSFSPVAGYGISSTGSSTGHTRWWGASAYASYKDWFGANISLRDKGEYGVNVDESKYFSPYRGAWYKDAPNGIEYSDVIGSISFNWNWGSVSVIKDYFQWGHGKSGQLILSGKAPSYPRINFTINPVEWLRFNYIHGWLNSLVLDSSGFYYSYPLSEFPRLRQSYFNKYIAANFLTISPADWLDVSLGNSIVYSGDLRPEFFIPFMFFKFLDHNTGRGDIEDGNGQIYFDFSVKYPESYHFYSTVFIDVTEIRNILKGDFYNTWFGLTLGAEKVDLFIPNLDASFEFTHISPWVYEHKDETTTYKHLNYYLGHWLGQNADQMRFQFTYNILRGLKVNTFIERVRKGGLLNVYYAYEQPLDVDFLYSPLRKDMNYGIKVSYEYLHDLVLELKFNHSSVSDEEIGRTTEFLIGEKNNLSLEIYYGL